MPPDGESRLAVRRVAAAGAAAATAKARQTLLARFEHEVDPDGILDPAERARRAAYKRTAHFQRLALKSAQARRKSAALTADAETAEAELAALGGDDAA